MYSSSSRTKNLICPWCKRNHIINLQKHPCFCNAVGFDESVAHYLLEERLDQLESGEERFCSRSGCLMIFGSGSGHRCELCVLENGEDSPALQEPLWCSSACQTIGVGKHIQCSHTKYMSDLNEQSRQYYLHQLVDLRFVVEHMSHVDVNVVDEKNYTNMFTKQIINWVREIDLVWNPLIYAAKWKHKNTNKLCKPVLSIHWETRHQLVSDLINRESLLGKVRPFYDVFQLSLATKLPKKAHLLLEAELLSPYTKEENIEEEEYTKGIMYCILSTDVEASTVYLPCTRLENIKNNNELLWEIPFK